MWAVFVPQGKCYKYWPSEGATLNTGHIEVTGVEEEGRAHFLIRTFDLRQLKVRSLPACVCECVCVCVCVHIITITCF